MEEASYEQKVRNLVEDTLEGLLDDNNWPYEDEVDFWKETFIDQDSFKIDEDIEQDRETYIRDIIESKIYDENNVLKSDAAYEYFVDTIFMYITDFLTKAQNAAKQELIEEGIIDEPWDEGYDKQQQFEFESFVEGYKKYKFKKTGLKSLTEREVRKL
jgi:hypothetical protein